MCDYLHSRATLFLLKSALDLGLEPFDKGRHSPLSQKRKKKSAHTNVKREPLVGNTVNGLIVSVLGHYVA